MINLKRLTATSLALVVLTAAAPGAWAADAPAAPPAPPAAAAPGGPSNDENDTTGPTPPRLSYTDGDVSFWRPGGEDWAPAQVNTPLAPGDQLYTGNRGNLELQIESRSFVRAWGDSQLGLENHTPDFLQLKVTAGHVSLDLRALDPGRSVELDTPDAAFTIERAGYYRVDVTPDRTSFITRRGGVATMTPAGGQAVTIAASEQVVVGGGAAVQTFVAPELDVWDRWNYARTEALIDTVSARYVPAGVSGVDDLDQHGAWRVVPEYGAVWVPEGVAADWAPYTTGRWIWDPRYGWTWLDTAPWGWAPYHYGRWVFVDRVWAWAPGPIVVRPAYAPALVAFFGAPGVRVAIGAPFVSWVALGWGEPCVPWWGHAGFVGRPWWGGWGGPRVVNNVVVSRTTVVNVNSITVYRNVGVRNAVVAVRPDRFGRGSVGDARIRQVDTQHLEPVRGGFAIAPDRASFAGASGRGVRPPDAALSRPVVATREPATRALPHEPEGRGPAPHIVPAPRSAGVSGAPSRPPFGQSQLERPRPPRAPRFESGRRPEAVTPGAPPAARRQESPARQEGVRVPEPARRPEAQRAPEPQRAPQPQQIPQAQRAPQPQQAPQAQRAPQPQQAPQAQRAPQPKQTPEPQRAPQVQQAPQTQRAPQPQRATPAPQVQAPRPQPRVLPGEPANRLYPGRAERSAPRAPAQPRQTPEAGSGRDRGPARESR